MNQLNQNQTFLQVWRYRKYPKFSDRYAWANSADPEEQSDQVWSVCRSVYIVWAHYSMVEPHSSNFRVITTNVLGVLIFRKFTVPVVYYTSVVLRTKTSMAVHSNTAKLDWSKWCFGLVLPMEYVNDIWSQNYKYASFRYFWPVLYIYETNVRISLRRGALFHLEYCQMSGFQY